MFIEILAIVFPIQLETSNYVPVCHPMSFPPYIKYILSMLYNFGPIFSTALLRTTINPLDLSNEVSSSRRTCTIIVWEFHVTMVEKELQCMAALQNHLCACSRVIAIIIGIIYLMFSPYEWFLYMIYVKIIMMFEFEFSIKLK
jgi:hypothetical protein